MFLTPHTSAALWISTKVTDPIMAFILGVVSHIILDMVPHGDDSLTQHITNKRDKFYYELKIATVDTVLAGLLILIFIVNGPIVNSWVMLAAVFGSWLPDLTWLAIEYFRLHNFYNYVIYHGKLHNIFNWQYSPVYGVPFQIVVTLLMLKMSF